MRRLVSGLAVWMCGLLLPLPAMADWTHASSDHFEVYTTDGARRAREALTYFERVHAFFTDYMKLAPKAGPKTRLIVFSNAREFRPYRFNDVATAYYRPGPDRDYIVMESLSDEAYPLVVHEYAHLIMRHTGANFPLWLNEGYAEFFSTLSPYGGQMSIGRVPLGRLGLLASGERMFDLDRLFAITHDSPEYRTQNHSGVFYSQSWALTHMLLTSEDYRAGSGRFLTMVGDGVPAATAMTTIYGKPLKQVQTDLDRYVRSDRFVFFSVGYKSPRDASTYQVRQVAAFEANLVTANLLAAGRESRAAARAAFDTLAVEKADDLGLLESRAHFELRADDREAAGRYFARAVELGSTNASTYRDYAMLLAGTDPVREADLLATALRLDPGDRQARLRLALILINRRDPTEALAVLRPITQIGPEDAFNFHQLRANALMQLYQVDEARAAVQAVGRAAVTASQKDYASRLLKTVDDFIATRASMAKAMGERAARAEAPAGGEVGAVAGSAATGAERSLDGRELEYVLGRLRNVSCTNQPSIQVQAGTSTLRLAIDNPNLIRVLGVEGITVDLQCGPQDRPVRVGFYRPTPLIGATAGNLRVLDYRAP